MKNSRRQVNTDTNPLDSKTAIAVDRATRKIVATLQPDHDQYYGFMLGFAAAWRHFTNHDEADKVFRYLDDTL
jgi:hypothetical protein